MRPIINKFLIELNDQSKFILLHTDLVFRLHEANRSLNFAYSLIQRSINKNTELDEEFVCFHNMNYAYFIDSAIFRIYATFDKIANILNTYTEAGYKKVTFEQFMRNYKGFQNDTVLMKLATSLFLAAEYKELSQLRQHNFHYITKESFINIHDSEWSNMYNMILASKNIELLNEIVFEIMSLFINKTTRS